MPDDRDSLDQWLGEPVHPMSPPPGTFELIRQRARRRKVRQAALSAAGVAVVVAVGVTVPRLLTPEFFTAPVAAHGTSPTPTHVQGPSQPGPVKSPTPSTPVTTTHPPAPPNFQVSSVTFVGSGAGGSETGLVVGQAGTAGQCTGPNPNDCTSIARTDDTGQSWYGVPAPVTGPPDGGTGVSQIRFRNESDGWVFGPELWATHDGGKGLDGKGWRQVNTGGMRVTGLETVGDRVFALWADCQGNGPDFASGCTSFSLYSAPSAGGHWSPVPGVTGLASTSGSSSASLLITNTRGYVLAPNGELYGGPVTSAAGWGPVTSNGAPATLPCAPGPAQAGGQPSNALLGAGGPAGLVLVCPDATAASQPTTVYASTDGGATWQSRGSVTLPGAPTSVTGNDQGTVVIATAGGIEVGGSASGPWRTARGTASVTGGFTYVGMTEPNQGIAIAGDTSLHSLWFTFNYARSWRPSAIP